MGRAFKLEPRPASVLVVEDDVAVRFSICAPLRAAGLRVLEADSCESALRAIAHRPELVISDLRLPDGNAIDLLPRLRKIVPRVPVLIITGHGTIDLAVRAVKEGAEDFLTKPVDMNELTTLVRTVIERSQSQTSGMRARLEKQSSAELRSPAMQRVEEQLEKLRDATCTVLLLGETGTGKSKLARRIHELGGRSTGPMVDINCAGLTKEFVEAELFGHERGAFTGAHTAKPGLLETASGGTLFLDEIGDLDVQVQPKLLKVLEEKKFRRMGDVRERSVDVRIIGATHHDLLEAASRGAFRADLFYRISTMAITLPPLRERPEDIVPLANRMLADLGAPGTELSTEARACLLEHPWPGNLRELKNVLERALLLRNGDTVELDDLRFDASSVGRIPLAAPSAPSSPSMAAAAPASAASSRTLSEMEREHIWRALAAENGRVDAAAQRLGIPRSTLYQRIKAYGLRASELRKKSGASDPPDRE